MGEYLIEEKKIFHNYLLVREVEETGKQKRFFAEDMRFSREVWIDVYPKSAENATGTEEIQRLETIAREIKKIGTEYFVPIYDLIRSNEAFYVVIEPPKGRSCSELSRCNKNTIKAIGIEIVRLMQWLQNHGFGIDHLSPYEIYFTTETQKIQVLFNDGICARPHQESREKEIKIVGELLYFLTTGEIWIEGADVAKKIGENNPNIWSNLIFKLLCDEETNKIQRLDALIAEMGVNTIRSKREEEQTTEILFQEDAPYPNKIIRLLLLTAIALLLYFGVVQTKTDKLQNISAFDVARYEMMGYFGVEKAQQALGEIYEKGYGTKINMQQSIFWYKKAAQNGNVFAQMSLGLFYYQGMGVASDKKKALYWFALAAANGDEIAQRNIEIINADKETLIKNRSKNLSTSSATQEISELKPDDEQSIPSTSEKNPITNQNDISKPVPIVLSNSNPSHDARRESEKSAQEDIMWQDNEDVVRVKKSWTEAVGYCNNLNLNGYKDWALPDKDMLFDLFFEQPDLKFIADDLYWTSSEYSHDKAWRVYFNYNGGKNRQGNLTNNSKDDKWYVRCYRKVQKD